MKNFDKLYAFITNGDTVAGDLIREEFPGARFIADDPSELTFRHKGKTYDVEVIEPENHVAVMILRITY